MDENPLVEQTATWGDPGQLRTIFIAWHPGEDFTAETTGTWLDFEIESALDEARLMLLSEEDDAESDG